jgi:peptidyl-prolyl cis-trans isomerase SurA
MKRVVQLKSKVARSLLWLCILPGMICSQNNNVIMVVNGDSISSQEFLRVYNKNIELVKDDSQKELDNYLQLFTDYQLKLQEAKRLKINKDKSYLRDFENYKRQLIQSYLSETKVTEALVQEAYERMKWDVKAVHILVRLDENERDTIAAYDKVLSYRKRLANEDFDDLKNELHNGTTVFAEDLGYFSAFKMVYSFENVAFETSVDEVSMPFRTRFGYHVLKVIDKRPSRGTMTAAHIMVANEQKDSTIIPEKRINMLYSKLQNGESFESLAKQFSDDKGSAKKGGELRPFKSGELSSSVFEDTVYALEKDEDYSKPFQTRFGWHIVKRIKLESLGSFKDLEASLINRVKRDSRSKIINESLVEDLRQRYSIYENPEAKKMFSTIFNNSFFQNKWTLPKDFPVQDTLFTINERAYLFSDFGTYLMGQQRIYYNKETDFNVVYDKSYTAFFEVSILKFREENLENENPEFAAVLKEYRDGLLLFDLMEREVWNKAAQDSTGLMEYYEEHKLKYQWKPRVEVIIASSADKKELKGIDKHLLNKNSLDQLKAYLMDKGSDVIITSDLYEIDAPVLPEDLRIRKNEVSIYDHNESYHLIKVLDVLPAGPKTFEEIKGEVTSDYQNQIEEDWMDGLKERFPVWINQEALDKLKLK